MHRKSKLIFSIGVMTIALTGCQSHQAKIDALQKEYDRLGSSVSKRLLSRILKVPPTLSPKCTDENKQDRRRLQTASGRTCKAVTD